MNKKKILILGITSIIGYRLYYLNRNYEIFGLCRKWPYKKENNIYENTSLNILYIDSLIKKIKPDIIINCISIANVDECERNPNLAYSINYKFTIQLLDLINKYNLTSINFSSSLIYDGLSAPFNENSVAKPLNKYGKQKLDTDRYLRKYLSKNILIRPTTIFGKKESFQRDNPVNFILNKILNKENLLLVDDVITNLLFIDDLVNIIYFMIEKNIYGEFNIGGKEPISRYELGLKINTILTNEKSIITKCNSSDFKSIAKRPLNTTLSNDKILKDTNFNFTDLDSAIKLIVKEKEYVKCVEY